ncbi:MAG: hypothetical protein QXQ76_04780 [Candidatus Bathyarchaeia archaeon]
MGIPRSVKAFTPDALNYALPYYAGCKALCGPGSEALYFWRGEAISAREGAPKGRRG